MLYDYMMVHDARCMPCTGVVFGGIFIMSHKNKEHEITKRMQKKPNTAMAATNLITTYIEPRLLHRVRHDETCSTIAAEMDPFFLLVQSEQKIYWSYQGARKHIVPCNQKHVHPTPTTLPTQPVPSSAQKVGIHSIDIVSLSNTVKGQENRGGTIAPIVSAR